MRNSAFFVKREFFFFISDKFLMIFERVVILQLYSETVKISVLTEDCTTLKCAWISH